MSRFLRRLQQSTSKLYGCLTDRFPRLRFTIWVYFHPFGRAGETRHVW